MLWSGAEAAEAGIRSFSFDCETPDGRIVKPLHGDIKGDTYTDLPAQRAQCLGTIDRKIALCWENTQFASEAENRELRRLSAQVPRPGAGMCWALFVRAVQVWGRGPLSRSTTLRASKTMKSRWKPHWGDATG